MPGDFPGGICGIVVDVLAIMDHISDSFPMIVHGQEDGYYKAVLKGERPNFTCAGGCGPA